MTETSTGAPPVEPQDLQGRLAVLRPELHRYCARLVGSVIDGEDIVQDVMIKALGLAGAADTDINLRAWTFRVAHNRAIDVLRSRDIRAAEPAETALDVPDLQSPDPLASVLREEAVRLAIVRFLELPVIPRSVVILKDVLDEPLADIAQILGLTLESVKAHLARGRARLRGAADRQVRPPKLAASPEIARYVELFNARDWDALRSLLADDVKLNQALRRPLAGTALVGQFFTFYAQKERVRLEAGWLDGREVMWVWSTPGAARPDYFMWLEWRDGRIASIHDYRYARYVMDGLAEFPADRR